MPEDTEQYRYSEKAVQRPDVGVQDQFQARKPPRTYRYDSSLDPELSWDERKDRDLGEWLLGLIEKASVEGDAKLFAQPQVWKGSGISISSTGEAIDLLKTISKPFLNWCGKAERHAIEVASLPLFVHERHSTKAILDGIRHRKARGQALDLFGDPDLDIRDQLEAYEHKGPWQNRMILGDSLSVMTSLLEYEGLGGQVQMIYMDPPYGVKFGSNFQPFVRKRSVSAADDGDMTREPEMVRAYRDTWELGLHSYLTYLRDRLFVAKELLATSGSLFVQISEENLHHVRELLDEVFGSENYINTIQFMKTAGLQSDFLATVNDFLLWYGRDRSNTKFRRLYFEKEVGGQSATQYTWIEMPGGDCRSMTAREKADPSILPEGARVFSHQSAYTAGAATTTDFDFEWDGTVFRLPPGQRWRTTREGMEKLGAAGRFLVVGRSLRYKRYIDDFCVIPLTDSWRDTAVSGFSESRLYVVQTNTKVLQRCIAMTTDPGDLVLDPTCGSGTTAYAAEHWGRRWITIDTSRVPLALTRQRLLTATYPYFELQDPARGPGGGFVYKRKQNRNGKETGGLVPHITLKSIANDQPPATEILVDRPETLNGVTRVSGPFAVEAIVAPVQKIETDGPDKDTSAPATHVERMTEVLRQSKTLQLPGNRQLSLTKIRRTSDTEYLHAEAAEGANRVAIVFGPEDGAISSITVYESAREAHFLKFDRLYFFGFAIQAKAREMLEDATQLRIPASYIAVTPDVAMADLLKTNRSSEIFSVTGLPDFDVHFSDRDGQSGEKLYEVELNGLDIFDPQTMESDSVDGKNVPCWMLDTDYDGFCFYASQVFFPKTSAWDKLQRSLGATFDKSVWQHLAGVTSEPFTPGQHRRVAVKVIDERGNELVRVKGIDG
ncbi:site-specific DNA-methyltransferase [Lentisalinibacter salinarum]|uniref:site-specific DNA-methyltransferase n=1 Tax=Lentisalinibacter salinarum TaxID=2992239 RepID=UPI00386B6E64